MIWLPSGLAPLAFKLLEFPVLPLSPASTTSFLKELHLEELPALLLLASSDSYLETSSLCKGGSIFPLMKAKETNPKA